MQPDRRSEATIHDGRGVVRGAAVDRQGVPSRPDPVASRVVALDGEHDLSTAEELLALLADAKPHARGHLVVDLSKVTFIDASCIGVLMQVRSELAMQGRTLLVRSPSTTARRVLDLCDLGFLVETPPRPLPSVGGVAMTGPGREPHGCS